MTDQVKVILTADARTLVGAFKDAGVSVSDFDKKSDKAARGFRQAWGEMKGLAGELGLAMGLGAITNQLVQFTASSYDAALAQKDVRNALTNLLGSSAAYESAIKEIQAATRNTISETEAAQTAFGLLDNGIAKSAEEAAQYALAGRALNAALGETASYEKFLMLLDEGSDMLLNNFNITKSAVNARKEMIIANTGLEESEARLQAVRELALEKGLALSDSMSEETIARRQAAASYQDFQASFGELVSTIERSFGVMEKSIWLFDQMAEGAEAWGYVLNEAIPAIDAANQANDEMAGKTLATAQSIEELDAALAGGYESLDDVRRGLIAGTKSYDAYNAKLDELAQLSAQNLAGHESTLAMLGASKGEYDAVKQAVEQETAALAAQNVELGLNAEAMRKAAEAAYYQAEAQQAAAGAGEAANEAWAARYQGMENITRTQAGGMNALIATAAGHRPPEEQAEAIAKAFEPIGSAAKDVAGDIKSAFSSAFSDLKSAIESQIKPTLDEVWSPPADAGRIDEAARRLATVSTEGFGSEWLNSLNTQFSGMDFWQPITEAMTSGDDTALRTAAQDILTNNVTALWDVELIKERVRADLREQNMRQEIVNTIAEEMLAEGAISGETAAGATGGAVGAAGGLLVQMLGDPAEAVAGMTETIGPAMATLKETMLAGLANEGGESETGAAGGLLAQMLGDPMALATKITGQLQPAVEVLKESLAGLQGGGGGEQGGEAKGEEKSAAGSGSALSPLVEDGMALDVLFRENLPGGLILLQDTLLTTAETGVVQFGLVKEATTDLNLAIDQVTKPALPNMKTAGEETAGKITAGMKEAARTMRDELIKAIEKAIEKFDAMTRAAKAAARAANTAGGAAPGETQWGGERAVGGPVSPGNMYLVGERGPELFVPGSSGYIAPYRERPPAPVATAASGGSLVIQNLNLYGVPDARQLFDDIQQIARKKGLQFSPVR